MFERFTQRARSVLVHAQDEAGALQHNFIGTEHLLLGVIATNDEVVTQALSDYDITLDDVRERVRALIGPGDEEIIDRRPFTPRAKKVLELSLREALSMGHDHIGVSHILLGIMREGDGVGAQLLLVLGVDYERTRMWVGQTMGEGEPSPGRRGRRRRARRIERFEFGDRGTPAVVRTKAKAYDIAGEQPLGTHHWLLAMLDEPESMAAKALESLGVTKEAVEAKVTEIGVENTSDALPRPPAKPATVTLAEGVEVRISDPDLSKLVESGQIEELLREIIRRSKPED
jgi:ATP-dependent Clp protease ATP-binding subunit ClpA